MICSRVSHQSKSHQISFPRFRYATGRVTGVVLDSGDGVTHAVPIFEGFAMPNSIMRVDIAGRDVTRHLRALIRKEGFNFRTTAEFEIVRQIKEKVCYLATSTQKEEGSDTDKITYTLPDGNTLDVCDSIQIHIYDHDELRKIFSRLVDWCCTLSCLRSVVPAGSIRRRM